MQQHMFTPPYPRCVTSTALILTVFLLISSITKFAYAIHADTIVHEDHNHPRILDLHGHQDGLWPLGPAREDRPQTYEPTFAGLDRSILGRAPPEPRTLTQETLAQGSLDIEDGEPQSWKLAFHLGTRNFGEASIRNGNEEHEPHEILKRQEGVGPGRLYITLCVCNQPSREISNTNGDAPPVLRVNISDSQSPSSSRNTNSTLTELGLGIMEYTPSRDAYVTVEVDKNSDFKGFYNYSLMASANGSYSSYNGNENDTLRFLDSDNNSALLVSQIFTEEKNSSSPEWQKWMNNTPPYSIFVYSQDNSAIMGIQNSICGLKNHAHVKGRWSDNGGIANVQLNMTSSSGGQPRQHFYVSGLNHSTDYIATMVDSTKNVVYKPEKFRTKTDNNCAVIYDLPFCTDTAYAVPTNTTLQANLSALTHLYDDQARNLYKYFDFSLQQIPCETTSSAQYSLARNCSDCAAAYKAWLCAVTIPRCQDYSAPGSYHWLQERSINQPFLNKSKSVSISNNTGPESHNKNSSRTELIETGIKPGPWKEVLPCKDLCYNLVQSCPAALEFVCPVGKWLNRSYGSRDPRDNVNVKCNDPRTPWGTSGAGMAWVRMNFLGTLFALTVVLVL